MKILWQGAIGEPVRRLQERLSELAYLKDGVDGVFGPATTAALRAFQKAQNIFADGIAGPQTLTALGLPVAAPVRSRGGPVRERSAVFISYSHRDSRWLERLRVHLAPLVAQRLVDSWDDTSIKPGDDWNAEITTALDRARVAVLLISADFMASIFIRTQEMPAIIAAARRDGAVILPVIVSPCAMGELSKIQSVNPPDKPLIDMRTGDRERVWMEVVQEITTALNA